MISSSVPAQNANKDSDDGEEDALSEAQGVGATWHSSQHIKATWFMIF